MLIIGGIMILLGGGLVFGLIMLLVGLALKAAKAISRD